MLRTKALNAFLNQVVGGGIRSVTLFNKEGLTVAKTEGGEPLIGGAVYSALLANIWDIYERPGGRETLQEMTIGCEQGIVLVRAVSSMLLAVVMEPQAPVGMVRLKMNALAEHLVVPLNALAQAM